MCEASARRLHVSALLALLTILGAATPGWAADPTRWAPLPPISPIAPPALATHEGVLHAVCVAHQGWVAVSTSERPHEWSEWRILGAQPAASGQHFNAAPGTAPVLLEESGTLYLFVRGRDDHLYERHRAGSADWTRWRRLSAHADVKGRLSVATTRDPLNGALEFHMLVATETQDALQRTVPAVDYRLFDAGLRQVLQSSPNISTGDAAIASDGWSRLFAVVRRGTGLSFYRNERPWRTDWRDVTPSELRPQNLLLPPTYTLSNIVRFAGSYHFTYSAGSRGFFGHTPPAERSLLHTRVAVASERKEDALLARTSAPDGEFEASLALHRNKLIAVYRDASGGWTRAAYWDSADPRTPWIGGDVVAQGRSTGPPALATIDTGLPTLSAADRYASASNAYGADLASIVWQPAGQGLAGIDLSRALFSERMPKLGLAAAWVLDDPRPTLASFDDQTYIFQLDRGRRVRYTRFGGREFGRLAWRDHLGGDFGASARQQSLAAVPFRGRLFVYMLHWDGNVYGRATGGADDWTDSGMSQGWQRMIPARGVGAGPMAAAFGNEIHLFLAKRTHLESFTSADGTSWSAAISLPSLPGGYELTDTLALGAAVPFGGRLHLFVRGLRSPSSGKYETTVWHLTSDAKGGWSGSRWVDLALETPSAPDAGVVAGSLVVVARDLRDRVRFNRRGATWEGWKVIPGSEALAVAPPAVLARNGALQVAVRVRDYELRIAETADGRSFSAWRDWRREAGSVFGPFVEDVRQTPSFTELGQAIWSLPHWMMSHVWKDFQRQTPASVRTNCEQALRQRAGGHLGDRYRDNSQRGLYSIWVNFNSGDRRWCGAHYNFRQRYSENLMHELGHTLSTALGVHEDGQPLDPGLEPRIPAADQEAARKLFGGGCPPRSEWADGRPRGFVNSYACSPVARQHDFTETFRLYVSQGPKLRQWIASDQMHGRTEEDRTLLRKKYDWVKTHLFGGIEFAEDGNPLGVL